MNIFDKAMEIVSPEKAMRRLVARKQIEVLNSGYSNYGAGHTKTSVKGWDYSGGSSREDIEDNLPTLRQRSRDLYMGVPLATGALKTYRTSVVGAGLSVKPKIDTEALGITEKAGKQLEKSIMREWNLWADSTDCDAARLSNFYELQQLAFLNWLMSGDVLVTLPVWDRSGSVYDLRVNLIEADMCYTPMGKEKLDNTIVDGVERNKRGEVVAYYIGTKHPLGREGLSDKPQRVLAYGTKTGRRNVLHLMNRERIGQVRGVPMLAPVVESLKQLGRYTEAEIVAAVISSYMTVFIEKEADKSEEPFGEVIPEEMQLDAGDRTTVEMAPGAIIDLGAGEKANAITPGRPNAGFDGFVNSICKQIGAALELPQELLIKMFTASYSASRGALLEAWKTFDMFRDWMVSGFCQPIYEEWFAEAVARGRIKAPGFWGDPAIRKTYLKAEWYGASRGQLDPKKETEAAQLRTQYGFSTATKESMELTGTDYADNMIERKREIQMMQEATGTNPEPVKPEQEDTKKEEEEE